MRMIGIKRSLEAEILLQPFLVIEFSSYLSNRFSSRFIQPFIHSFIHSFISKNVISAQPFLFLELFLDLKPLNRRVMLERAFQHSGHSIMK